MKISGGFLAFFCLFLGVWLLLQRSDNPNIFLGLIGAFFAAMGAIFFFSYFTRNKP
jgi:purine-cytosine permease-like protein